MLEQYPAAEKLVRTMIRHQISEPPKVPPVSEFSSEALHALCVIYRDTPNIREAMKILGNWDHLPEDYQNRLARDYRLRGDTGPYIKAVDQYYFELQQKRQEIKAITDVAADVYSSLPVEPLTETEKAFIYAYAGDIKEAMKMAGITPNKRNKLLLLKNPFVQECKGIIDRLVFAGNIVDTAEALSILSDIARDPDKRPVERMQALKLLLQQKGELTSSDDKDSSGITIQIAQHMEVGPEAVTIATHMDDSRRGARVISRG
jgi:hypothetical protein